MGRVSAVALTFLALLPVAGCNDETTSSACDLLTDREVTKILGEPTRPGIVEDDEMDNPGTTCLWIARSSTEDPEAAVYGVHLSESSGAEARHGFDAERRKRSRIFSIENVEGLGDEAYFVNSTEPNSLSGTPSLPRLEVRVGDRFLSAGTFDSDEHPVQAAEAKTLERAAARLAVARLARR